MSQHSFKWMVIAAASLSLFAGADRLDAALIVNPVGMLLDSPEGSQQLLVTELRPDGRRLDLTRQVQFEVANPEVATIDAKGLVRPLGEGATEILIQHETGLLSVPLVV